MSREMYEYEDYLQALKYRLIRECPRLQRAILGEIYNHPGITLKGIAQYRFKSQTSIASSIRPLRDKGFVLSIKIGRKSHNFVNCHIKDLMDINRRKRILFDRWSEMSPADRLTIKIPIE